MNIKFLRFLTFSLTIVTINLNTHARLSTKFNPRPGLRTITRVPKKAQLQNIAFINPGFMEKFFFTNGLNLQKEVLLAQDKWPDKIQKKMWQRKAILESDLTVFDSIKNKIKTVFSNLLKKHANPLKILDEIDLQKELSKLELNETTEKDSHILSNFQEDSVKRLDHFTMLKKNTSQVFKIKVNPSVKSFYQGIQTALLKYFEKEFVSMRLQQNDVDYFEINGKLDRFYMSFFMAVKIDLDPANNKIIITTYPGLKQNTWFEGEQYKAPVEKTSIWKKLGVFFYSFLTLGSDAISIYQRAQNAPREIQLAKAYTTLANKMKQLGMSSGDIHALIRGSKDNPLPFIYNMTTFIDMAMQYPQYKEISTFMLKNGFKTQDVQTLLDSLVVEKQHITSEQLKALPMFGRYHGNTLFTINPKSQSPEFSRIISRELIDLISRAQGTKTITFGSREIQSQNDLIKAFEMARSQRDKLQTGSKISGEAVYIFFENIDDWATAKTPEIANEFLIQSNDYTKNTGIRIFATTAHPEVVLPSVKRVERFDITIPIGSTKRGSIKEALTIIGEATKTLEEEQATQREEEIVTMQDLLRQCPTQKQQDHTCAARLNAFSEYSKLLDSFDQSGIPINDQIDLLTKLYETWFGKNKTSTTFLLYGLPGTGKSFVVKKIPEYFKTYSPEDISSSEKVVQIFTEARARAIEKKHPVTIFLDEVDQTRTNPEVVATLKQELEKPESKSIIVLGATNVPNLVPTGLFGDNIQLTCPNQSNRFNALIKYIGIDQQIPHELTSSEIAKVNSQLEGFSWAELNLVIREAWGIMKSKAHAKIMYSDFATAAQRIIIKKARDIRAGM